MKKSHVDDAVKSNPSTFNAIFNTTTSSPTASSNASNNVSSNTNTSNNASSNNTVGVDMESQLHEEESKRRFAKLCDVFAGATLKRMDKIDAKQKRDRVIGLFQANPTTKDILSGDKLIRGEHQFEHLAAKVKTKSFRSKAIKEISQPVMILGRLIHEEHCEDDDCGHDCRLEGETTLIGGFNASAAAFKELFELGSFHSRIQDEEAMKKQNGKKTSSKKTQRRCKELFLPHNASK